MAIKRTGDLSRLLGGLLGLDDKTGQGPGLGKNGLKSTTQESKLGKPLDNDLLLFGRGFSKADKTKAKNNRAEEQNIVRFLKDPKSELSQLIRRKNVRQGTKADMPNKDEASPPTESTEKKEATVEQRREEQVNEARVQAHDQAEPKELHEQAEAKDPQHVQRDDRENEEEGRGAGGWVLEDAEDEDDRQRKGGDAQVFSDVERCHRHLEDGTRCLRKSQDGSPFCLVHRT